MLWGTDYSGTKIQKFSITFYSVKTYYIYIEKTSAIVHIEDKKYSSQSKQNTFKRILELGHDNWTYVLQVVPS